MKARIHTSRNKGVLWADVLKRTTPQETTSKFQRISRQRDAIYISAGIMQPLLPLRRVLSWKWAVLNNWPGSRLLWLSTNLLLFRALAHLLCYSNSNNVLYQEPKITSLSTVENVYNEVVLEVTYPAIAAL